MIRRQLQRQPLWGHAMNRMDVFERILNAQEIFLRKAAADIDILSNHGSTVGNDGISADHDEIHTVCTQ